MANKVFIGVGHGGTDPGAVANGFKEKDLNLNIALACNDMLARYGVITAMSRTKDDSEGLETRIKECNAFNPDYAVEIHNNAGGGDGAEIYHSIVGGKGKTLAQGIASEINKIGQNLRLGDSGNYDGIKTKKNSSGTDYFGWIRQTNAPAVLVECAFMDSKDITIIDTPDEQKAMGIAIAKGILKALGISFVQEINDKIYRVQVGAYKDKQNAVNMQNKLKAAGFDAIIV